MISSVILAVVVSCQSGSLVASPERQKELLARINRKNMGDDPVGPPLAAMRPSYDSATSPTPKPRPDKKAAYRRHNARYQAELAAEAAAQAEYERKMAPYVLEAQRQQRESMTRQYEAELRHKADMDFNDAIRGVTRGRP